MRAPSAARPGVTGAASSDKEEHVKRQVISTDSGPRTGLPYSQAIRHGDTVYVAGQVALDPKTGQVVAGGIREQTQQVLQNIEAILRAAGTSLAHAVECLCLLHDIGDFAAFNEVYKGFFPKDPPARTTVQAVLPRPGLLVEIRTVAGMPPARAAAPARKPARRTPAKRRR
jgi:2-iminobutanoate/2-iminopropanoate deaminase